MSKFIFLLILLLLQLFAIAQVDSILLKKYVYTLASDSFIGRYPATIGDTLSSKFILDIYKKYSCKLFNKTGTQKFNILTDRLILPENKLYFDNVNLILRRDFIPALFSDSKEINAPAYFAGYGIMFKDKNTSINHYFNTQRLDGWILFFSGKSSKYNIPPKSYSDFNKCVRAKEKGASGIIIVCQDNNLPEGQRQRFNIGIPVIYITYESFKMICGLNNLNADSLKIICDTAKIFAPIKLRNKIYGKTQLRDIYSEANNIICIKKGKDKKLKHEYIVVGAHYDHLGLGGPHTISRMPDTIAVHNGADDNATGVASLLELIRLLEKTKTKRSIIFIAFGAEEMGLIGSNFFVKNSPVPISNIKAMLNIDMIGRVNDSISVLTISGTSTSSLFEKIIDSLYDERKYIFKLTKNPEGDGPSDHASFYYKDIPVLFFNTGLHLDYHTPFDDADKINYKQVADVTYFINNILLNLANYNGNIDFQKAKHKEEKTSRHELSFTLGLIPDFSNTIEGLKVLGVKENSIAQKAGIKKDDIIVRINDCVVSNIYDYMECLSELAYDTAVVIEILRNRERIILSTVISN